MLLRKNIKEMINYKSKDGPTKNGMVTWIHEILPLLMCLQLQKEQYHETPKTNVHTPIIEEVEFVVVALPIQEGVWLQWLQFKLDGFLLHHTLRSTSTKFQLRVEN